MNDQYYQVDIQFWFEKDNRVIPTDDQPYALKNLQDDAIDFFTDMKNSNFEIHPGSIEMDELLDLMVNNTSFLDVINEYRKIGYFRYLKIIGFINLGVINEYDVGFQERTSDVLKFTNFSWISYDLDPQSHKLINKWNTEYIQQNYRPDACVLTFVIDTWGPGFKKFANTELTYESLHKILFPEQKQFPPAPIPIPCSLDRLKKYFLMKYRLRMVCLNTKEEIEWQVTEEDFAPKTFNRKFVPTIAYAYAHNDHLYGLHESAESLTQIYNKNRRLHKKVKTPSQFYNLPNMKKEEEITYIDGFDQLHLMMINDSVAKIENEKVPKRRLATKDLTSLMFDIVEKLQYEPQVQTSKSGCITKLTISVNNKKYTICKKTFQDNPTVEFDNTEKFKKFLEYQKQLQNELLNRNTESQYSESVSKALLSYQKGGAIGKFNNIRPTHVADINKDYTHQLMKITSAPTTTIFDDFTQYTGDKIKDQNFYIVKADSQSIELILLDKEYQITSGYLVNLCLQLKIKIEILAQLIPSRFVPVDIKPLIKKMYDEPNDLMSIDEKKAVPNVTIGMMAKIKNKAIMSHMYTNISEAKAHFEEPLQYSRCETKVYIGTDKKEIQLINGWYWMALLVYDFARIDLFNLTMDICKYAGKPVAVKTDAVYYESPHPIDTPQDKIGRFLIADGKTFDSIGTIKIPPMTDPPTTNFTLTPTDSFDSIFTPPPQQSFDIKDEYDDDEFKNIFDNHTNVFVGAICPGAGKTFCLKQYAKNNKLNAIFIAPHNALCEELGQDVGEDNAITIYKLLGINLEMKKCHNSIDVSNTQMMVFDEFLLNSQRSMALISKFMQENPHIKYYATGDRFQNKPIDTYSYPIEYYLAIKDQLFPKSIFLKINKRNQIEGDIVIDICERLKKSQTNKECVKILQDPKYNKYITFINDFTKVDRRISNIVSFHNTSNIVNDKLTERLGFKPRDTIICKQYFVHRKMKFNTNIKYILHEYNLKEAQLIRAVKDDNNIITIPTEKLKYFRDSFTRTCVSVQGLTIDNSLPGSNNSFPMTIFDVINNPFAQAEWIITAITRCKRFNIQIFETELTSLNLLSTLGKKVQSYKAQDEAANRPITTDYITKEFLYNQLLHQTQCTRCGKAMNIDSKKNIYDPDAFTWDRIDSKLAHTQTNVRVCCRLCNSEKSDN